MPIGALLLTVIHNIRLTIEKIFNRVSTSNTGLCYGSSSISRYLIAIKADQYKKAAIIMGPVQ